MDELKPLDRVVEITKRACVAIGVSDVQP